MNNNSIPNWLKSLLPIIAVVAAIAASHATLRARQESLSEKVSLNSPVVRRLEIDVPQITQDIRYIQRDLEKIQATQQEILKELRAE